MSFELDGRVVVFAGPSLPPTSRPTDSVFAWRPPARAGDAIALAGSAPRTVVLIDGLFDESPAIRHKELLELIAAGTPVIGGASMGALRAAELQRHGMIGVGRIFAAYAAGHLTGDDEVAMTHGPEEWGWPVLTEALVNVRATLVAARRARVLDGPAARGVLQTAIEVFYKQRTWAAVIERLAQRCLDRSRLAVFEAWLPSGQVNLKQLDALTCLEVALDLNPRQGAASLVAPSTLFTHALRSRVLASPRPVPGPDARWSESPPQGRPG